MNMKTGLTLNEMIAELDHRHKNREDYIADPEGMHFYSDTDSGIPHLELNVGNDIVTTQMKELAQSQLMQRLDIPASYERKVLSLHPELRDGNINYLLKHHAKNPLMVRTLDGSADAVLSNAYKRMDNWPVAERVIPILHEAGVKVESCQVTDHKMYIKVVSERLQADVKVGDPVQLGLIISNSEVGLGFLNVQTLVFRLVCDNGMISGKDFGDGIRMAHRGSRQPLGIVYGEDTMRAHGHAIGLQVRDTVKQILAPENFNNIMTQLRETTERRITGNPVEAVKQLGKTVGFTEDEGSDIMRFLIEGGDISQYGMAQAVTRFAQEDKVSYDRSTELERVGGKIIELAPRPLKMILEAA
jgi:hypothetical protein